MSVVAFEATVWVHSSALRRPLKTAAALGREVERIKQAVLALYPDALSDESVTVEVNTTAGKLP